MEDRLIINHKWYDSQVNFQSNKTEKPKKSVNFSDSLKPSNSASNNKKLLNDYPVKNNYVHKQADEDSGIVIYNMFQKESQIMISSA